MPSAVARRVLSLQRSAGNRAVSVALASAADDGRTPRTLTLQREPVDYEPGESDLATRQGVVAPDVMLLGGTGSAYNASADSILVSDFRPSSSALRASAASELRATWIKIIEGKTSSRFALLGFTDAAGEEAQNQRLRADRAHAVAAVLRGTAGRGVVGAAPVGDFIIPANSTREQRALNRSVLVRLPPAELRQEAQVDEYSADAVAFWRTQPNSTVDDLIGFVSARAGALLVRNGVPQPDVQRGHVPKGSDTLAYFNRMDWTITVDVTALTAASPQAGIGPSSRMADLTVDAVADLSQACYHEARHAEQTFLAARLTAEEGSGRMGPDRLARRTGIKMEVAEEAILASSTVLPDVLKTKAKGWRAFGPGGRYVLYKKWNEELQTQLAILTVVYSAEIDKWVNLGPGEIQAAWQHGLHPLFDKTFRRGLADQGATLVKQTDASPHRDPVDMEVRQALNNTVGKLALLLAREAGGRKLPGVAAVVRMTNDEAVAAARDARIWLLELKIALLEANAAAKEAYAGYANEADAYQTGEAVRASVTRLGEAGP